MSVFETISRPLFNGGVFRTDLLAETHYFYCTFNTGYTPKDKISRVHMQTTGLAAGRVSYHGGPYGINEPAIDKYGLFSCGAFENRIGYSDDLSVSAWVKSQFIDSGETTTTPDGSITKWWTMGDGYVYQTRTYTVGATYTYGFWAKADRDITIGIRRPGTYSSPEQVDLTTEWQFFSYSGVAENASGNFLFENRVSNGFSGTEFNLALSKIRMYESSFLYPYVDGLSPENFSDADQGYKFPIDGKLLDSLYGTDGTDAQGKLTVKWRPMFNSGDLTGSINILTANDEASSFLFFDADNDLLKLTDGTNTSHIACSPVAGTEYEIIAQYDETNGMVISLDGTAGTTVAFAGRFPNAYDLSYFWEAEAPQYVKITSIEKESGL